MKKKLFTMFACFAVALVGAITLVGCGETAPVSFGKYSSSYNGKDYVVASTTWKEVEAEKGFDGAYELTGNVEYNNKVTSILGFDEGTTHFVAIRFNVASGVKVENPTYKVDDKTVTPFDTENEKVLVLIKGVTSASKNFTVTINWNKDTTVKYSFNVEKAIADNKLDKAPENK